MTDQLLHAAVFAMRMSAGLVCSIFVLAVIFIPTGARAEYQLSIGDKVRIYVFGQKELDQSAIVDGKGQIWVPTLGHIQAAGRTLPQLRQHISSSLTANEIIRAEDVNVDVIEFRPVYIDGTVTNPGSYPYSIGLTVRQAIAIAGGFRQEPPDLNDPTHNALNNALDERESYQSLWSQYIQRHARVARIQAELQGKDQLEWTPPLKFQGSPDKAQRIRELEEKNFKARVANFESQKSSLDDSLRISANETTQLKEQYDRESNEYKIVSERLSQLQRLQAKGILRAPRVNAYEINMFLIRSRFNSTAVQLVRAKRNQHDLKSQRQQIEIARREELTRELQSALNEMEALHSQMIVAANKLLKTNAIIERVCAPKSTNTIFIHRRQNGQNKRLPTSGDGDVQPGDVIEVNIINDALRSQCPPTLSSEKRNREKISRNELLLRR